MHASLSQQPYVCFGLYGSSLWQRLGMYPHQASSIAITERETQMKSLFLSFLTNQRAFFGGGLLFLGCFARISAKFGSFRGVTWAKIIKTKVYCARIKTKTHFAPQSRAAANLARVQEVEETPEAQAPPAKAPPI